MKILILGGTAFTGPHIVNALSAQGHEVRLYHRGEHRPDPLPPNVKKVNADLASLSTYGEFLRKKNFDVVLHMIAMTRSDARDALNTLAGYVGRCVVISSHDVYASYGGLAGAETPPPTAAPLEESAPLRTARYLRGPENPHEKIDVEQTFLENAHRLPVTILRLPIVFGPNDPRHRFFPYLKRFEDRRPAVLLDPDFGNFRQAHGYVENVAHAITLAVTTPHPTNEGALNMDARIFNISEYPPTRIPSTAERLHDLARAAGYKGKIILLPKDRCPPHLLKNAHFQYDQIVSDAAIRRDLGYAEIVPPDEAYRRTIAWHRTATPPEIDPADFDYETEDRLLKDMGL